MEKCSPKEEGECWPSIGQRQRCRNNVHSWVVEPMRTARIYVCVSAGARCWSRRLRNVSSCCFDLYAMSPPLLATDQLQQCLRFPCDTPTVASQAPCQGSFPGILLSPPLPNPRPWGWHGQHMSTTWMWYLLRRCKYQQGRGTHRLLEPAPAAQKMHFAHTHDSAHPPWSPVHWY